MNILTAFIKFVFIKGYPAIIAEGIFIIIDRPATMAGFSPVFGFILLPVKEVLCLGEVLLHVVDKVLAALLDELVKCHALGFSIIITISSIVGRR